MNNLEPSTQRSEAPVESPESAPYRGRPDQITSPRSSVIVGSLWMVGLSLVLFFVPLINGLVGGLVGGYKVGSVGRALLAAIIPAVVVAIGLWVIFALFEAPVIGLLAGIAAGALVLLADIGLFIGAAIGGAVSNKR